MNTTHMNFRRESLALALFFIMGSARLQAQATASEQPAEKLQPGQMPYFDAVLDPIEGFNRCSWEVNDWLFRDLFYPVEFRL